eukprot:scaffold61589_cov29-Tisochrysis_lutea.AAC.3
MPPSQRPSFVDTLSHLLFVPPFDELVQQNLRRIHGTAGQQLAERSKKDSAPLDRGRVSRTLHIFHAGSKEDCAPLERGRVSRTVHIFTCWWRPPMCTRILLGLAHRPSPILIEVGHVVID